jgi:hypothetical protein
MPPAYPFPTPLPVLPRCWKVRIFGTVGALPSGNDLLVQQFTGAPPPTDTAVATLFANKWAILANSLLNNEYAGQTVGVYNLSSLGNPLVEVPMLAPGGVAGAALPIATCALIKHNVGVRGKVGKTFLSPISTLDTDTANNNLGVIARGRFQVQWDNFAASINTDPIWGAGGANISVLSMITAKALLPQALHMLSSTAEIKLASQNRRRLR